MQLYRQARVKIGLRNPPENEIIEEISFKGLRVSFSVTKHLGYSANTANLSIWNLSQSKRNRLVNFGDQVILYAGYQIGREEQIVFIGDTSSVSHSYDLPDIVTTFECGEGERLLNNRRVKVSYSSQPKARQVILDMANQMGIQTVQLTPGPDLVWTGGRAYQGMGKDGLTKICDFLNLQWSIQNETLVVIPKTENPQTDPIYTLNKENGMIGVPQRFTFRRLQLVGPIRTVGWRVRSTLRPEIKPGDRIRMKSDRLSTEGLFRVDVAKHEGDTHGDIWHTEFELTQLEEVGS